ncbi:MAG: DUF5684 domain-containing protein [Flavobacteriales bacterium]
MSIFGLLGFGFLFLANVLLAIISLWRLFENNNKPGWASLVPVYNIIVLLDILELPKWLAIFVFIPILSAVFSVALFFYMAKYFKRPWIFALGLLFFPPVFLFVLAYYDKSQNNGA